MINQILLPPLPEFHTHGPVALNPEGIRVRDLEVARFVLEAAAKSLDRLDKQARRYFAEKGSAGMPEYDAVDCARHIRALEVRHE